MNINDINETKDKPTERNMAPSTQRCLHMNQQKYYAICVGSIFSFHRLSQASRNV